MERLPIMRINQVFEELKTNYPLPVEILDENGQMIRKWQLVEYPGSPSDMIVLERRNDWPNDIYHHGFGIPKSQLKPRYAAIDNTVV